LYFDGSDVGLGGRKDDVNALAMDSQGAIYLSTAGNFSVAGVNGADEDVFVFRPMSLGTSTEGAFDATRFFDGSEYGLGGNDVSGFDIP